MYKTYKLAPLSIIGSLPRFFINKPVRTPNSTPKINPKKRYIDLGDLEIYITGSTGLQADAGDHIYVFANTDGGAGNIRGMYTVTAKIRE